MVRTLGQKIRVEGSAPLPCTLATLMNKDIKETLSILFRGAWSAVLSDKETSIFDEPDALGVTTLGAWAYDGKVDVVQHMIEHLHADCNVQHPMNRQLWSKVFPPIAVDNLLAAFGDGESVMLSPLKLVRFRLQIMLSIYSSQVRQDHDFKMLGKNYIDKGIFSHRFGAKELLTMQRYLEGRKCDGLGTEHIDLPA